MHKYFNPNRFTKIADKILPFSAVLAAISLALGLYYALYASPVDYQQGEYVRIMYIHVPSAWMAMMIYSFIAAFGAAGLVWRNPLSHMVAISAAPIGAGFTFICLVTGSLWGKPIWGTWWVWDARLTSVLILLFFYLGYISLYNAYDDKERAGKSSAILAIIGFVNIPIIKFSVDWWNTLHQPASIIRSGGMSIDKSMLIPLLLMFFGFINFFITLIIIRTKAEILDRKIVRLQVHK
jgi:heme exporter protein C